MGKRTQEESPSPSKHKEIILKKPGKNTTQITLGSNASQSSLSSGGKRRDSLEVIVKNKGSSVAVNRTRVDLKNSRNALENLGLKQQNRKNLAKNQALSRQQAAMAIGSNHTTPELLRDSKSNEFQPRINQHYKMGVTSGEAVLMVDRMSKSP